MSECQMCHSEDATVGDFCEDCWNEMVTESVYGQDVYEYWEIDDEPTTRR